MTAEKGESALDKIWMIKVYEKHSVVLNCPKQCKLPPTILNTVYIWPVKTTNSV